MTGQQCGCVLAGTIHAQVSRDLQRQRGGRQGPNGGHTALHGREWKSDYCQLQGGLVVVSKRQREGDR